MLAHQLLILAISATAALAKLSFTPPLPAEVRADLAKKEPSEYQLFHLGDKETGLQKRELPSRLKGLQTSCKTNSCFDFTFDDGPYVNMRHITDTALANNFKITFFLNVYNWKW